MNLRRAVFILSLALAMHSSPALGGQSPMTTSSDHEWCGERSWGDDPSACEVREFTMDAEALRVDSGGNGSIAVEAWDGTEIQVAARVVARARDLDRARELIRSFVLEIGAGEVAAGGSDDRGRHESAWVSFRIRVPRNTDLELDTSNGGIAIEGVQGRLRFEASNGSVRLLGVSGDVRGRTSNGSVRVELAGDRWEGRGLDVETSNGSVRLAVPEGYSAHLETGTVNGRLELDFPVTVSGSLTGDLSVDLGDGGATVRVRTTNGSVRIGRSL